MYKIMVCFFLTDDVLFLLQNFKNDVMLSLLLTTSAACYFTLVISIPSLQNILKEVTDIINQCLILKTYSKEMDGELETFRSTSTWNF